MGEVLLQAANLLVAVDTQLIPHKLLRNLTVAAMKAAMHRALLGMLPEGTFRMSPAVIYATVGAIASSTAYCMHIGVAATLQW